jgi:hypothetical protein
MEIDAVVSGEESLDELEVGADFLDITGASGVVAGGLDASGERSHALEASDIVGLPAMQGNLLFLQLGNGLVGIYANGSIAFLGQLIRFKDICFFHIA